MPSGNRPKRLLMAVDRKYERDIDLLLAEEFSVNPAFAVWFLNQTKFAHADATVVDVHVSKADTLGESDLIVVFESTDGDRFALLIEDKIDAPLQPDQALRYHQRAAKEVKLGLCAHYEIVLAAPRHYIHGYPGLDGFDVKIAHEDIGAALAEIDPSPRGLYRSSFVGTAASKRINKWKPERDPATDAFWEAAYRLATDEFSILEMKRISVTKGSTWINFRPRDMPTMPKRIYISLKGDRGLNDLTFSNTNAHQFGGAVRSLLEPGMSIHQTAASAAVRLETEGFLVTDVPEDGMRKVRSSFDASARLIEFYRKHREVLDKAAMAAVPI